VIGSPTLVFCLCYNADKIHHCKIDIIKLSATGMVELCKVLELCKCVTEQIRSDRDLRVIESVDKGNGMKDGR